MHVLWHVYEEGQVTLWVSSLLPPSRVARGSNAGQSKVLLCTVAEKTVSDYLKGPAVWM